jgi:hypothetical protein
MALKLALPLPDKAKLALAGARLRAWWNGEDPPALEVVAPALDENGQPLQPQGEQGEDARLPLLAAEVLWGSGRSYPSHAEFDGLMASTAGATKDKRAYLFDTGTGAGIDEIIKKTSCRVEAWIESPEQMAMLGSYLKGNKQAKRTTTHKFDGTPGSLPKGKADAGLFVFQGGDLAKAESLSFCMERILRAESSALWLDFFARTDDEALDAARGPERRQFLTEDQLTGAWAAAGLMVRADDDWSAQYLDVFTEQWRALSQDWDNRQGTLIKIGGIKAAASAYEQALAWKARADAVRSGRLTVRRYILAKQN